MKDYHGIWLQHSRVEPEFLMQALACGFQIHHIDEDRHNNDPMNLMLIFGADHMKIHGRFFNPITEMEKPKMKWADMTQYFQERLHKGRAAYELRVEGMQWHEIATKCETEPSNAMHCARAYAAAKRLQWPVLPPDGSGHWAKYRYNQKQKTK